MDLQIDKRVSVEIWYLKAIAIFTIFFAHMPISESNTHSIILKPIFDILGMIGVPMFLFLSGYLFKKGNVSKRITSLVIPLLIWGTFTFIVHLFKIHFQISLIDYLKWVGGSKSYLYFVTILIEMIILFNLCNRPILWGVVNLLFIIAYQYGFIHYVDDITPYMNPLNFILYFSLGVLVRKYDLWTKIQNSYIIILGIIFVISPLVFSLGRWIIWYFNLTSISVCLGFTLLLINLVHVVSSRWENIRWLKTIGSCSFVIYLSHMQVATTLNKVMPHIMTELLEPIKVAIAFCLVVGLVVVMSYIIPNSIKRILGYR